MAWTAADLRCVEQAIRELVAGKREVAVTIAETVTQYNPLRLQELIELRDAMREEIAAANPDPAHRRTRAILTRHTRGL